MADISSLGALKPIEPLDLSQYKDNQKSEFRLPRKGTYTLQAPETFAYSRTRGGNDLSIEVSSSIVGPSNEGFKIRFQRISAKQWKDKDGATKSQIGDYLRAFGDTQRLQDEQGMADAVEQTANRTYEAELDWEVNHFATKFKVKGMTNFPKDVNGEPQSWVAHPTEKGDDGEPLRLRANLVVTKYLPAV